MPIVSSTFTPDAHRQVDGRRYVIERHVDSTGQEHQFVYLADDTMDPAAIMAARVAQIDEQLAQAEYEQTIAGGE